jgi:hypothetical protein
MFNESVTRAWFVSSYHQVNKRFNESDHSSDQYLSLRQ